MYGAGLLTRSFRQLRRDTNAPIYAGTYMNHENPKLVELRETFHQLLERLRSGGVARERYSTLGEVMTAMYEVDLEQRLDELKLQEEKLKQAREFYEFRRKQRDKIIKTELKRLIADSEAVQTETTDELFAQPSRVQLQIVSDKTENGIRKMKVHTVSPKSESRTKEVSFIAEVEQSRTKVIDGKRIEFTVGVPEMRVKTEAVKVQVPVFRVLEFEVPEDEDWGDIARQKLIGVPRRT